MYPGLIPGVILLAVGMQFHLTEGQICNGDTEELTSEDHNHKKNLTSPNYPDNYFNNELCKWHIKVRNATFQVIKIQVIIIRITESATCNEDYVEFRDGASSRIIKKYCGDVDSNEPPAISASDSVLITFRSDNKVNSNGFLLQYWSVPKDLIRFQKIQYGTVNYALFGIFFGIIVFIAIGMIFIVFHRKQKDKELAAIAKEQEEKQALMLQKLGEKQKAEKGQKANMNGTTRSKGALKEAAKKDEENNQKANGGDRTHIISLEPEVENDKSKTNSSTTPV